MILPAKELVEVKKSVGKRSPDGAITVSGAQDSAQVESKVELQQGSERVHDNEVES